MIPGPCVRDDADVCSKLNQEKQLYLGHSVSHGAANTLPALHTPFISSGARQCYQNNLDVQWLGTEQRADIPVDGCAPATQS